MKAHGILQILQRSKLFCPPLEEQRTKENGSGGAVFNLLHPQSQGEALAYLTWGRQKGLPEMGFLDFDSMQAQLTKGYSDIAQELKIPVAPVGEAFKTALSHDANAALWGEDGSHPSLEGTYLAACVFYAAIYQTSPVGLDFTAGLSADQAKAMQTAAAETVLTDPGHWGIFPSK